MLIRCYFTQRNNLCSFRLTSQTAHRGAEWGGVREVGGLGGMIKNNVIKLYQAEFTITSDIEVIIKK